MHIIDSHFHWWPRAFLERLCDRTDAPRAERNARGGYGYYGPGRDIPPANSWAEWHDLEKQFEHMDRLGHRIDVVNSIGPFSIYFSDLPGELGRSEAMLWNETMAETQARYPGRFMSSAAIPLVDADVAVAVLNHAVLDLGLMGANLPGSVGNDSRIDAARLEPFYARAEELDVPLFLHPTDAIFTEILDGYNGALHLGLGRVIEVSVAAMRIVFSGIMERHPKLKLVLSHTGGALPYQSGRMDKNGGAAALPRPPSEYLKRMYTDTVSPHAMGIKFAIDYYGIDHVMYGTDYPCWDPATALRLIDEIPLSEADRKKLFHDNAVRILGLERNARRAAAE